MIIIFVILMAFVALLNPNKGFFSVILMTIMLAIGLIQFPSLFVAIIVGTVIYGIYYVLKNNL